jgi:hypothetical protein
MKKIAVYSSMIGPYDNILPVPDDYLREADFYLFTDQEIHTNWTIKRLARRSKSPRRDSREPKICPQSYLPGYFWTIYLDTSISMLVPPDYLITKYREQVTALRHPFRDCIYNEAEVCLAVNLITKTEYDKLIKLLTTSHYPHHNGLTENGVIIRQDTEETRRLAEFWKIMYDHFGERDQLTFCYALWKLGINYGTFVSQIRRTSDYEPTEFFLNKHL